jgi:hypothetical protein
MKIIALELSEVTGLVKAALPLGGGMAVTKSRLFPGTRVAIFSALALLVMVPAMYPQTDSSDSTVTPDISDNGPDVSNYVSPSLEPGEHEYMRSAINQLPASMKEKFLRTDPTHVSISVYDAASGEMHYNRPELAGNLHLEPSHPLPGDDYPLAVAGSKAGSPAPSRKRSPLAAAVPPLDASPEPDPTGASLPHR